MKEVLVLQCDNRWDGISEPDDLVWDDQVTFRDFEYRKLNGSYFRWSDFVRLNVKLNSQISQKNQWTYKYHPFDASGNAAPHWEKIRIVADNLPNCQWMVFLDTDAWIREPSALSSLIDYLEEFDYQGAFSREPYLLDMPFVNTGSFVLRSSVLTTQLWAKMEKSQIHISNKFKPPYEEELVSEIIFNNRSDFFICKPDVLNTPSGKIIRHSWTKSEWMYKLMLEDLIALNKDEHSRKNVSEVDFEGLKDQYPFPSQHRIRLKHLKRLKEWIHAIRKTFR